MSSNFRFVAYAAQAHAHELAAQRARNASAQAGFAHPRGTVETDNGGLQVSAELENGEVFEDAVLHLDKAVMVLVQHSRRALYIQLVLRVLPPGQIENPVHVISRDGIIRCRRVGAGKLFQFVIQRLGGVLRQVLLFGPIAEGFHFACTVAFAQLLLNGLQLLAQKKLPLLLIRVALDTGPDLFRYLQYLDFPAQVLHDQVCPVHQRMRLQKRLLSGYINFQV